MIPFACGGRERTLKEEPTFTTTFTTTNMYDTEPAPATTSGRVDYRCKILKRGYSDVLPLPAIQFCK